MKKILLALVIGFALIGSVFAASAFAAPVIMKNTRAVPANATNVQANDAVVKTPVASNTAPITNAKKASLTTSNAKKNSATKAIPSNTDRASIYGMKGDMNDDGAVNFGDINNFRMVLENAAFFQQYLPEFYWRADINNDGQVNDADVNAFVALLSQ